MTKAKKSCTHATPAAGQQITKYYTRYAEEKGETKIDSSTDGYTLYRAIARQVIGLPSRFLDIRNAVLQFYLRAYANNLHPLHDELVRQQSTIHEEKNGSRSQVFALLDSPDLDPNEHVLWVIAYALKVRIDVFESITKDGEPQGLIQSVGPKERPVCAVVRRKNLGGTFDKSGPIGMPFRFESLLPDESGKALIEYLQAQKENAARDPANLQVKQMSWAWIQSAGKESWTCFNEYRPESKVTDLEYNDVRDRMDTFVVTVNESKDVAPALDLLREALRRAPNQRRWVRHSNNTEAGFMLPHCSVDAEFVKMERVVAANPPEELTAKQAVDEGVLEELCSVLTFAVGRHFFLLFNVVHMLETSDKLTVAALTNLFRETIFNKNLLKLWWNPQSDITVLEGTLAHLYQQTPRESYEHTPWNGFEVEIEPKWRIKRNHFQNVRPDDLHFPKEWIECEIHRYGANEQGIFCCCRLGNIDIAALFTHLCKTHGLASKVEKLAWTAVRRGFRYGDLLERMLRSDRLYPIMNRMKNSANNTGKSRDAFYQDMGRPGMELEDNVMAYNIGDVAGQNMIFEQLVASDDSDFIAGCLDHYGGTGMRGSDARRIPQRPSAFGSVGGIQLWEDNPKSFGDRAFEVNPNNSFCPKPELYSTETLKLWEHDQRVALMRAKGAIELQPNETHYSGAYVRPTEAQYTALGRQRDILMGMHDPTRMEVPGDCVQKVDSIYEDPVMRAGTTHSEALLELLESPQVSGLTPPAGFGAAPGDANGLPAWLKRVPGKGLEQARNLFDAFQRSDYQSGKHLGKPQTVFQKIDWRMQDCPSPNTLFEEAWQAEKYRTDEGGTWGKAEHAKFDAGRALEAEQNQNEEEGLPYSLDTRDFFDLEGRDYRQRAEQAQSWNRLFQPKLAMSKDGNVKSLAFMQVEVLNDYEGFKEVVKKPKQRH